MSNTKAKPSPMDTACFRFGMIAPVIQGTFPDTAFHPGKQPEAAQGRDSKGTESLRKKPLRAALAGRYRISPLHHG